MIYAHREDAEEHTAYRDWLASVLASASAYGVSELVLSTFIRVVTNVRAFPDSTPLPVALDFAEAMRERPNAVVVAPGPRHWDIFTRLCRAAGTKGNLVADAYLAALAIESGSEWITTNRDYARFPGLRWRHPLAGAQ